MIVAVAVAVVGVIAAAAAVAVDGVVVAAVVAVAAVDAFVVAGDVADTTTKPADCWMPAAFMLLLSCG